MTAKTQYRLTPGDLETVLALVRCGTLAAAGERLALDSSTVFRNLQRIERGTQQRLFERSRNGYLAGDLALELARHGERLESEIEAARSLLQTSPDQVSGRVSITTTDTILHGLVAPALRSLHAQHPQLQFDLQTGNEPANLTRRDADIAVRATRRPPEHLIGHHLGAIRVALYASHESPVRSLDEAIASHLPWIAPDDALPDHPSVVWRRKHLPKINPTYRVDSILAAAACVDLGMGIALLPMFLANLRPSLRQISADIAECSSELWLLAHPESRHLRRISTVFHHLAQQLRLE